MSTALLQLLREHGFKGSAPTLRRFRGSDTVHVVNLQRSAGGGSYVNLGAHFKYLSRTSWTKIREYECAFRARLHDFAGGDRFFLDDDASVIALVEMMGTEGLLWFGAFEPASVASTVKHVAKQGYDRFVPLGTPAGADTWARVARHMRDSASEKRLRAQATASSPAG